MKIENKMDLIKRIIEFFEFFEIDDLLNIIKFGIPLKRGTMLDIRENNFHDLPAPVFFLSTGRCGTKWFAELLAMSKNTMVFHEPKPNLSFQGKNIYQYIIKYNFELPKDLKSACEEVFLVGREQYLKYSFKTNKRLIETNNQLTFFAPIIEKILPQAKFVHLYRNPLDFIRSGLARGYYNENDQLYQKRIKPMQNNNYYKNWKNLNQTEKIAWLWFETNNFIENFKKNLSKEKIFNFNFDDINNPIKLKILFSNFNIEINDKKLKKLLGKKINKQKKRHINDFSMWHLENIQKIKSICGELSNKYNYYLN